MSLDTSLAKKTNKQTQTQKILFLDVKLTAGNFCSGAPGLSLLISASEEGLAVSEKLTNNGLIVTHDAGKPCMKQVAGNKKLSEIFPPRC